MNAVYGQRILGQVGTGGGSVVAGFAAAVLVVCAGAIIAISTDASPALSERSASSWSRPADRGFFEGVDPYVVRAEAPAWPTTTLRGGDAEFPGLDASIPGTTATSPPRGGLFRHADIR